MSTAKLTLTCPSAGDVDKVISDFFAPLAEFVSKHRLGQIHIRQETGEMYGGAAFWARLHSYPLPNVPFITTAPGKDTHGMMNLGFREHDVMLDIVGLEPGKHCSDIYANFWEKHTYLPKRLERFEVTWEEAFRLVMQFYQTLANKVPPKAPGLYKRLGRAIAELKKEVPSDQQD
jgi:hypothetical protein